MLGPQKCNIAEVQSKDCKKSLYEYVRDPYRKWLNPLKKSMAPHANGGKKVQELQVKITSIKKPKVKRIWK